MNFLILSSGLNLRSRSAAPEPRKKPKIENYVAKPILSSQMKDLQFNSFSQRRIPTKDRILWEIAAYIDNLCIMIMIIQLWHTAITPHSNR
jgi:hypothetical protein